MTSLGRMNDVALVRKIQARLTIVHDCHDSRDTHAHCLNFEMYYFIYARPQRLGLPLILRPM